MTEGTDYVDYAMDLMAPIGPLRSRRMFGGYGIYSGKLMVAIVINDELFLKVDEDSRDAFESAGSEPFVYRRAGKDVAMSYYRAPDNALDSPEHMKPWADLAYEAAHRTARKRKR